MFENLGFLLLAHLGLFKRVGIACVFKDSHKSLSQRGRDIRNIENYFLALSFPELLQFSEELSLDNSFISMIVLLFFNTLFYSQMREESHLEYLFVG